MSKRILALIFSFILIVAAAGCDASNIGDPQKDPPADGGKQTDAEHIGGVINVDFTPPAKELHADIVKGNSEFGIELMKKIYETEKGGNIFISPASISIALAMTMNGADNETRRAMLETLGLEGIDEETINLQFQRLRTILENPDPKIELSIANSIWARKGLPFEEDFLNKNKTYFDAKITELDFDSADAADIINKWVRDKTNDKIDKMVEPPIDPATIMFLMNAIYFNGTWETEFDSELTKDRTFYHADGTSIEVPMMERKDGFLYLEDADFQSVYLPYGSGDGRIGMYIFLPEEYSSLDEFAASIDSVKWAGWMKAYRELEGTVVLPKFKFEYEISLNDTLKAMGMELAFDSSKADFGRMFPVSAGQNVYISEVKHKSFVDAGEKGTEAAAVTSVENRVTSMPLEPTTFSMTVDRPFLFSIVDNLTGTILFMGTVEIP